MDRGFTLWFTGLSGSGKSTLALRVEAELRSRGKRVEVLDGDIVRTHLSKGLGFSRQDRDINILRIGFVCGLLSRNGIVAISAAISPYRETRDQVRAQVRDFVEVYVDCSLEECIRRDTKGLYRQALQGKIEAFTGISDPYEPPVSPEITVRTVLESPEDCVAQIMAWLEAHGYVESVFVGANAVGATSAMDALASGASPVLAYSESEEAEVSARLEALGYL